MTLQPPEPRLEWPPGHAPSPDEVVELVRKLQRNQDAICQQFPIHPHNTASLMGPITNVKDFGAKGNGSDDDTEALQKARSALGPNGGTIFLPYGVYKLSGQLNFDDTRAVRLIGGGGLTAGNTGATQLLFTQSGSEAAISARSSVGFGLSDMQVHYNSGSFTGRLLDLSHSAKETDAAYGNFERCNFAGQSVRTALGVDLDKAIVMAFRGCYFQNCDTAVRGQKEKGRYSNSIRFDDCIFTRHETAALKNAGEAWYVTGCTFDTPIQSGAAGALTQDAEVIAQAVTISGCWMGDLVSTSGESTWVTFRGHGLVMQGNLIGGSVSGGKVTALRVPTATSTGIQFTGNRGTALTNGVILETGVARYIIGANQWGGPSGKKASLDGGATDAGEGFLSN